MRERPAHSAFAAAFLSYLLPGLGHVYLGRWLRAIAWVSVPLLVVAGILGIAVGSGPSELLGAVIDPGMLGALLGLLVADAVYRALAVLDAYVLATDRGVGSNTARTLSRTALAALLVVLAASHVAVARPVLFVADTIDAIVDGSGDDSEIIDLEKLAALDEDFVLRLAESSPGSAQPPTPAAAAASGPPETPRWDGKKRVDVLLIGAIIEARSCERFAAVAHRLPEELGRFYLGLLSSEARHFEHYLRFAQSETGASDAAIGSRLEELLEIEAALVTEPDAEFRFHSGAPDGSAQVATAGA